MATADVLTKIGELKRSRNAIILAHNYQRPEVQDILREQSIAEREPLIQAMIEG